MAGVMQENPDKLCVYVYVHDYPPFLTTCLTIVSIFNMQQHNNPYLFVVVLVFATSANKPVITVI